MCESGIHNRNLASGNIAVLKERPSLHKVLPLGNFSDRGPPQIFFQLIFKTS
jgi:hypothetical protein